MVYKKRADGGHGYEYAHRVAFKKMRGPIVEGMVVCHKCDNPVCCNPSHLFLGTQADNLRDMRGKGRGVRGSRVWSAKLREEVIPFIRGMLKTGATQKDVAIIMGVSKSVICAVANGKAWRHVPEPPVNRP